MKRAEEGESAAGSRASRVGSSAEGRARRDARPQAGEQPAADAVGLAERELHALDAALEKTRRRLYAVENGLLVVADPASELATLRAEHEALGERFREAYRRWQAAERAASGAAEPQP